MSVLLAVVAGLIALSTGRVHSWSRVSEFFSGIMRITRALHSMSRDKRPELFGEERGRHYV